MGELESYETDCRMLGTMDLGGARAQTLLDDFLQEQAAASSATAAEAPPSASHLVSLAAEAGQGLSEEEQEMELRDVEVALCPMRPSKSAPQQLFAGAAAEGGEVGLRVGPVTSN